MMTGSEIYKFILAKNNSFPLNGCYFTLCTENQYNCDTVHVNKHHHTITVITTVSIDKYRNYCQKYC